MGKTSQEIVASIDDLLTEIFLRLPIKSLIIFKQVSKHWQSLISDPGFGIRRNPIPNPAVGMFAPCCYTVASASRCAYVSFSDEKSTRKLIDVLFGVKIIQSCNGLLLCSSLVNMNNYFVYNPTTNKSSMFPFRESVLDDDDEEGGTRPKVLGMSLAFDPARSRHYKVVCVRGLLVRERFLDFQEYEYGFEVYSSENGCWRKPAGLFTTQVSFDDGVYWNGAIHWFNYKTRECLYFNPDDDDLMVMPRMTPAIPGSSVGEDTFYFGESCGHLNYVEFARPRDWVNVYELRRDYSEWFVKYFVDLSTIYEAIGHMKKCDELDVDSDEWHWFFAFSSTMLVRGEKDEDSFMVVIYSKKVVLRYNFVRGTCETICDFRDDEKVCFSTRFQYIESLCVI